MSVRKDFIDINGDDICLVRNDKPALEATYKTGGVAQDISGWTSINYTIKTNLTDTVALVSGTGTIIDNGSVALRGRFDVILDLTAAGITGAFAAKDEFINVWIELKGVNAILGTMILYAGG